MEGAVVGGLTGELGPVLLVRPVPPPRATVAGCLLAAHPVPVGSGVGSCFGEAGTVVWELCDPAADDEPPWAVVITRPRGFGAMVELLGAAACPRGPVAGLLRRLFADVAAALRPAGCLMLIACVPRAEVEALDLLVAAGFVAQPGPPAPPSAPGRRPRPPADSSEGGQRDVIWFAMEL